MEKKARLCYIDTKSFIFYMKTEDIFDNTAKDVKTRFDASNYELECYLKEKNKKVIGSMKDELSGEIMTEFCHSSLTGHSDESKKTKDTRNGFLKQKPYI